MDDYVRTGDATHRLPRISTELSKAGISMDSIDESSVVVVPSFGLSGYDGPAFPSGTRDLVLFLRKNCGECSILVAASEDSYRELAQHADLWLLPVILVVDPSAASFVAGLLSNYVYDRIVKPLLPGQKAEVESEIIVKHPNRTVSIRYRGPAESFDRVTSRVFGEHAHAEGQSGKNGGDSRGA